MTMRLLHVPRSKLRFSLYDDPLEETESLVTAEDPKELCVFCSPFAEF